MHGQGGREYAWEEKGFEEDDTQKRVKIMRGKRLFVFGFWFLLYLIMWSSDTHHHWKCTPNQSTKVRRQIVSFVVKHFGLSLLEYLDGVTFRLYKFPSIQILMGFVSVVFSFTHINTVVAVLLLLFHSIWMTHHNWHHHTKEEEADKRQKKLSHTHTNIIK